MDDNPPDAAAHHMPEKGVDAVPGPSTIVPTPFGHLGYRYLLWPIIPIVGIEAAAIALILHQNPLMWYVRNWVIIAALFSLVSIGMDLDRYINLISLDPNAFYRDVLRVAGIFILMLATIVRGRTQAQKGGLLWEDFFLGVPLAAILGLSAVIWIFLIMPVQYFTFAIFGAPARLALHAVTGLVEKDDGADWTNARFRIDDLTTDYPVTAISFLTKPVTVTSTLSAVGLAASQILVG
jgi:hypothetical protein